MRVEYFQALMAPVIGYGAKFNEKIGSITYANKATIPGLQNALQGDFTIQIRFIIREYTSAVEIFGNENSSRGIVMRIQEGNFGFACWNNSWTNWLANPINTPANLNKIIVFTVCRNWDSGAKTMHSYIQVEEEPETYTTRSYSGSANITISPNEIGVACKGGLSHDARVDIDYIRVWNKVLTDSERQDSTAGNLPAVQNIITDFELDFNLVDSGPNNYQLSVAGSAIQYTPIIP